MDFSCIVGVIQVRSGSKRLRRKCFRTLGGMTMLERVLLQANKSDMIDRLIISTSDSKQDNEIVDFATEKGILCTRGPLDDIVQRMFVARAAAKANMVVRLWGDCPFMCPKVIDRCIRRHISTEADLTFTRTSTYTDLSYPPGQDMEVYKASIINELHYKLDMDSELRTFPRIALHQDAELNASIEEVRPDKLMPGPYLAVDYEEDLVSAEELIRDIGDPHKALELDEILSVTRTSLNTDQRQAKLDRNPEYNAFIAKLASENKPYG